MSRPKTRYAHTVISEKEKGKPTEILKHKHPSKMNMTLDMQDSEGKNLKIKCSIPNATEIEGGKDFIAEKCVVFRIASELFYAVWRDNPNKGFFFISGNKKSVHLENHDLKHVPNRILTVLKYTKKCRKEVLSTIRKCGFTKGDNSNETKV
jgi:hypothetical protein